MKKVLVLGGSSSVAENFLIKALTEGYEITATTRKKEFCLEKSSLRWEYLDLDSEHSILNFIASVSEIKFDVILDFIGKTSKSESQNFDFADLNNYFKSQITNHVYLLLRIKELLSVNGSLIYLSSRSVEYGSFDIPYAASKAAIHNSFFSLKNKLLSGQKIINVLSGLIEDSTMFKEMSTETILSHQKRAGAELITIEKFAVELIELCRNLNDEKFSKYSLLKIGPDYE